MANRTSPAKALEVWVTESPAADGVTVAGRRSHHVECLADANGRDQDALHRRYIANDIAPELLDTLQAG